MKDAVVLRRVIAQRELVVRGSGETVAISVGEPTPRDEDSDWACPYRITIAGKEIVGSAIGVDSLQSLQLVTECLRGELERLGLQLDFLGSSNWQSFFPVSIRDYGEPSLRKKIEALVIEEQSRWLHAAGGRGSSARPRQTEKIENSHF